MIINHRQRKAEIDARADNFEKAKLLGEALVKQQHYARTQVWHQKMNTSAVDRSALHKRELVCKPRKIGNLFYSHKIAF